MLCSVPSSALAKCFIFALRSDARIDRAAGNSSSFAQGWSMPFLSAWLTHARSDERSYRKVQVLLTSSKA